MAIGRRGCDWCRRRAVVQSVEEGWTLYACDQHAQVHPAEAGASPWLPLHVVVVEADEGGELERAFYRAYGAPTPITQRRTRAGWRRELLLYADETGRPAIALLTRRKRITRPRDPEPGANGGDE